MASNIMPPRRPVLLVIMDGIGVNPSKLDNAVALAKTPNLDRIYANHPVCLLEASGRDGGVHSHTDHVVALIRLCQENSVQPILHAITDGRDTAPGSASGFLKQVVPELDNAGGFIATVSGRYYAMDRDKRWERVQQAWQAMVLGEGREAADAAAALSMAADNDESDEFISPTVLPEHTPWTKDSEVFFFNFRNDRPRELSEAIGLDDFSGFDRAGFDRRKRKNTRTSRFSLTVVEMSL